METMIVNGIEYRAEPEYGGWFEWTDEEPSGTVGRTYIPMMADGSPASEGPVEIRVSYEDA